MVYLVRFDWVVIIWWLYLGKLSNEAELKPVVYLHIRLASPLEGCPQGGMEL